MNWYGHESLNSKKRTKSQGTLTFLHSASNKIINTKYGIKFAMQMISDGQLLRLLACTLQSVFYLVKKGRTGRNERVNSEPLFW